MFSNRSFWQNRKYHLDEMTLRDLVVVFYQYPAILLYHALFVACVFAFVQRATFSLGTLFWIALAIPNFSLSWYLLHRFLLHSTLLYRFRFTARLWKRIHFDHHSDPNDLRVLFGAPLTTLPPMLALSGGVWLLTHNLGHAIAFFAASVAMTVYNEFCHCIQHLGISPRNRFLLRIKRLHLIHHFKNEKVYYGITNFFWDRLLGTFPADPKSVPTSETVFNLGYRGDVETRYPWVAQLTRPSVSSA